MYIQKSAGGLSVRPRRETRDHGDVVVFEARLSDATIDSDGDVILPEAWAGAKAESTALCWQHKFDQPIGVWTDIELRGDHLWGRGEVSQSFELGRQAGAMLLAGGVKAVSVGFRVPNRKSDIVEKEVDYNGKKRRVREIRKAELLECSLVTRGANPSARVAKGSHLDAQIWNALGDLGFKGREIERAIAALHRDDDGLEGFKHIGRTVQDALDDLRRALEAA